MEVDDSSFFGTPEVMLRPRQRLGADGLEAYPTPVAGFSTNKKLRDNMSFSAFSPGSALRKPFNDITNSSLQTVSPTGSGVNESLLNSAQKVQSMNPNPHSPGRVGIALCSPNATQSSMKMEDLSRTPVSTMMQLEQLPGDSGGCVEGFHVDKQSTSSNRRESEGSDGENADSKRSLYKRIIQEASHALPRTPAGLSRGASPAGNVEEVTCTEEERSHSPDEPQRQAAPQFGVGKEFRFGSGANPGFVLQVAPTKGAAAAKRRPAKLSHACQRGSTEKLGDSACGGNDRNNTPADCDRLQQLEKDLAREKALRAELQETFLKSVEVACFGSSSSSTHGGGANCQPSSEHGEEETRETLAHSKELDLLRSQLETQDQVIDMLCKKIPCKDVIETLGGSALRTRGAQEAPHMMHSIVEESPSGSSSSSSAATPVLAAGRNNFDGLERASAQVAASPKARCGGSAVASDGSLETQKESSSVCEGGVSSSPATPQGSYDSLCNEVNVLALEHAHSSLEGANSSLDRALSATSIPSAPGVASTLSPTTSATQAMQDVQASRAPSLSPDVSSLTTVVRLTKEIQTLRQLNEGGQRLTERATAECTSLSTRCSKLEKERSTLSASFHRLANTLSESIATSSADEQAPPSMKALARILEEARVELNDLQEHASANLDTSLPTISPATPQAWRADSHSDNLEDEWDSPKGGEGIEDMASAMSVGNLTQSSTAAAGFNMDLTAEWYQSWYEPEGDDAETASFAFLNVSRAHRGDDDKDACGNLLMPDMSTSLWSVQEVSVAKTSPARPLQDGCKRVTTWTTVQMARTDSDFGDDDVLAESEAQIVETGAMRAAVAFANTSSAVVGFLRKGVWLLLCLGLHLLSVAILVGGIAIVMRQRQLVGVL